MYDYRAINCQVMTDTKKKYETNTDLVEAVKHSIEKQFMVTAEEDIALSPASDEQTNYVFSGKRSFEAAKTYKGKKVAVLNFANNHCPGGAPFSAGAQEESLCRCSTLLPCISAMFEPFYEKHRNEYDSGIIDNLGSDDLIYTPDIIVFKTDERTDPVIPQMMEEEEWYKVDVITCAAPQMNRFCSFPENYESIISSRIKKILDVAAQEKVEVLILGAWGCGAFANDSGIVSKVFCKLLKNYAFPTVEFALACKDEDVGNSIFTQTFKGQA